MNVNEKINKRLKILTDYDKRQELVEADAIRLVARNSPNMPLIPVPESANIRKLCAWCSKAYWGKYNEDLCPLCSKERKQQTELSRALRDMRRQVERAQLQAAISKLKELQDEQATPQEILETMGDFNWGDFYEEF